MLEAQLATAEGRFDDALAAIDRIPDDHPIAAQAYLLAGRIERQRRRIRKAEAAFRHALAIKPGLVEAHKELIYILGIQSRRREVDAEFRTLAGLTTLTHHDLFTWALTHFTHWNPDIVEDLDGFIKADPEDRYSRLAVVELLLERPERRVVHREDPRAAARIGPRRPGAADQPGIQPGPVRRGRAPAGSGARRITRGSRGSAASWPCGAATSTRRSGISATP